MKAWMSSNFNQIPPLNPELSALAHLKNCCEHFSAYIFDWIFFILSGGGGGVMRTTNKSGQSSNFARSDQEMQSYSP